MIVELNFVNPITNNEEQIRIHYPIVNYFYFKHIFDFTDEDDIISILERILIELDCTREYNCGRICMTNYPIYWINLSDYYFYILKLSNQILYNEYIDKLIKRHIDNLVFEFENPYAGVISEKKHKTKHVANKYIKKITKDIFTGKDVYVYYNPKTKDEITSDNPNLLEELNATKHRKREKVVKVKRSGVSMNAVTFSFKKK